MVELLWPLQQHFGPHNRAGIDGCLHRISAMRAHNGEVYLAGIRFVSWKAVDEFYSAEAP